MPEPQSKDWSAVESSEDFAGGGRKITVRGRVYVGNLGDSVVLNERDRTNTDTLGLDLTVQSGAGGTVMNWKTAEYVRPLKNGERFSQAEIYAEGSLIETMPVEHIPS